ncbi:MAG TPA: ScyD/ScyE family protein [Aquihabitans sp.]|nr:ScyD/ScyE family protein [Aquihabitans sp.]
MRHRRSLRRALSGAVLVLGAVAAASPSTAAPPQATVLVSSGLSSPKGLALDKQYQPIVGQGAFGPPGPILRYRLTPPAAGTLEPVSPVVGTTALAYVRKTNTTWVLGNDGKLYRQHRFGEAPRFVADLVAYAAANPDPFNSPQDGPAEESNPFGLTALPNGNAIVTDAAANSILRVTPSGRISLVARLPKEAVPTDHIGAPGLPPVIEAEAVPTGVTIGPDGHIYVGELKGFPFRPGSSRIWRIEPNASGAVCSVDPAVRARRCRSVGQGYTSIAALAFDQHRAMYVFQYAAGGVGAFEAGCESPAGCPPAVLLKVATNGARTEVAPGELFEPGSLAVRGSTLYATDRILSGGRLLAIPT